MAKPCTCGSELPRRDLVDARGIFCTFVCDNCEDERRGHYDPRIFEGMYDAPDLGDDTELA